MIIHPLFLAASTVCSSVAVAGSASTSHKQQQSLRKLQPGKDEDKDPSGLVDPSIYWDSCWVDLPPDVQAGYVTLGYTEDIWTNAGTIEYDDYDYWMLPKEQKEAAISLGITEEYWCEDPVTGENGCFVSEADIPPEFASSEEQEWDNYDWWELPAGLKEVLLANKYTEETWCVDKTTKENECLVSEADVPSEYTSQYFGDSDWVELPDELKDALESAGVNEESWCTNDETGESTCTLLEADVTSAPTTSNPTPNPTPKPITSSPTDIPTPKPITSSPTDIPTPKPITSSPTDVPTPKPVDEETTTTTEATTIATATSEPSSSPIEKPKTSEPTTSPPDETDTSTETSSTPTSDEPGESTETTETTSTTAPDDDEPDANSEDNPFRSEPSDAAVGLTLSIITTTFVGMLFVSIWS